VAKLRRSFDEFVRLVNLFGELPCFQAGYPPVLYLGMKPVVALCLFRQTFGGS
jgi:hypothetical protein